METPSKPSEVPKPIYKTETTGSLSGDVKEAVTRLSLDDFHHIGEMPCVRNSLMSGIASGAGIGIIRSMTLRTNRIGAFHWAFGTFTVISVGTWAMCQKSLKDERERVRMVIEAMPRRMAKKAEEEVTHKGQSPAPHDCGR
ncbi:hypothetical protein BC835DRAFT_1343210 [Cytidiella melzeri]|nr:hypothetical protein BC835DRAFT_1343210 [Cytidiella melzeri]